MTFDCQYFKSQFPLFSQAENKHLIYLDNAATTQKPQSVIDAITQFYLTQNGNAERASHRLARKATEMVEQVRQQAAAFMGTTDSQEVVFTSGATEGLNIIAHGLAGHCTEGDEIVVSHQEHHANLLPWQRLAKQQQCRLIPLPDSNGQPDLEQWYQVVNERTRVIALSAASNVLGVTTNLSIIAQIKERFPQVIVVLDASQIACHMPLQAQQWQCDFMVCSAHKFYGPTGVGLLYGRSSYLAEMPPLHVGGEMVETVTFSDSRFVRGAKRFEAGTSSLSAIAGLGACFDFWQLQDRKLMQQYEQTLTYYLYQQLSELCQQYPLLKLVSTSKNNIGLATLIVDNSFTQKQAPSIHLADMALWLDEHDIAVRVGNHCAQPLWQSLANHYGSDKGLRISLTAYNSYDDIDRLCHSIEHFLQTSQLESPVASSIVTDHKTDDLSTLDIQDLYDAKSWQQRFKILRRWGQCLSLKPEIRIDQYQVKGCEAEVWIKPIQQQNRFYFLIDTDANVIKGLSALLLLWFNGKTSTQIDKVDVDKACRQLGLQKHLTPSRMNGFNALLTKIKTYVDVAVNS